MNQSASLLEGLLSFLPADPVPVKRVLIGLQWTMITSRFTGLASTIMTSSGHHKMKDVGNLEKYSAQELAHWILSDNELEASIGMAAINSLIEFDESTCTNQNADEVIATACPGKNLVIVGHFPFVDRMRAIAANCQVLEKNPQSGDLPASAAADILPSADVVAITGTSLINHTITDLLPHCRKDAVLVMLGPSTPLSPLLFQYGISYLSGARVIDPIIAAKTIEQGAIFPQVAGVKLFTMKRPLP